VWRFQRAASSHCGLDCENEPRAAGRSSRAFWNYFTAFDWHHEVGRLHVPILLYAGSRDKQRPRDHDQLILRTLGIDVIDLDGLDHAKCGLGNRASPATSVVTDRLQHRAWTPPDPQ
jgi:hypothetical protein